MHGDRRALHIDCFDFRRNVDQANHESPLRFGVIQLATLATASHEGPAASSCTVQVPNLPCSSARASPWIFDVAPLVRDRIEAFAGLEHYSEQMNIHLRTDLVRAFIFQRAFEGVAREDIDHLIAGAIRLGIAEKRHRQVVGRPFVHDHGDGHLFSTTTSLSFARRKVLERSDIGGGLKRVAEIAERRLADRLEADLALPT